ncbi:MAG: hypothetical protein AAFY36_11620 [Bacteroidota bacterium]
MPKQDTEKQVVPPRSSLLDSIQQNSWELELLISGFAIFLLLAAVEPVHQLEIDLALLIVQTEVASVLLLIYYPFLTSLWLLIGSLLIHVLLRGLWIAAIGLRYVSGDIDYTRLKYQPKFSSYLKKRIGGFDDYIERLEQACSIAFSLSFVLIFSIISLSSFLFITLLPILFFGGSQYFYSGSILSGLIIGIGLLYFVDFITLGFFKRNEVTQWYFPIYRVGSWLSLSRFYRPLYHNLIDNRIGRKWGRSLPFLIIGIFIAASVKYIGSPYFDMRWGQSISIRGEHYDDMAAQNIGLSLYQPSLDSRYVGNDGYLEIFTPYLPTIQDPIIARVHPDLHPAKNTGLKLRGVFVNIGTNDEEIQPDSLLNALSSLHRVYLNDSLIDGSQWRFYRHELRKQNGLIYHLDAFNLPRGEHQLRIDRQWPSRGPENHTWSEGRVINFYR